MKGINIVNADSIKKWDVDANINGKWVCARPVGLGGLVRRFKCAWLVFTGKADVIKWHKQ